MNGLRESFIQLVGLGAGTSKDVEVPKQDGSIDISQRFRGLQHFGYW